MARLPSCPDCGVDIVDKTTAKRISNRWVCKYCQEIRKRDREDREELYSYVSELFRIDYPTGMMMKQIKDFKEDFNYTYKGMTLSLKYWCETLGRGMDNAKGVGIIPYIYEDARNFYIEKLKIKRRLDEMGDAPFTSVKKVYLSRDSLNTKASNTYNKIIDMNDLL